MENIWLSNNVTVVHCELSTFCNAACPNCPRFFRGTYATRAGLTIAQVTNDQFKNWFDAEFISKVAEWKFCGTLGDPMMAKDVIKIIEYIFSINPNTSIMINTNGGMRNDRDWNRLGKISSNHNLKITFSVDGLEDTNHLYRRNVEWNKLILNINSYIKAGGKARWEFLIFKHNEHQIEEARTFSKQLGFVEFFQKRAFGFEYGGQLTDMPVFNQDGEYDYSILPPSTPEYRISKINLDKMVIGRRQNLTSYYKNNSNKIKDEFEETLSNFEDNIISNDVTITCNSKKEQNSEIYVNVSGIVYPCCFMGTSMDTSGDNQPEGLQLKKRFREYGLDKFDLNNNSITKILNENHLNLFAANTWETPKCLEYCKKMCGNSTPAKRIYDGIN